MAKEKDIAEKTLENYNDVFADIVNTLIFDGMDVVKPEELTDAVTTSQVKVDGLLHEQERDTAKYWNHQEIRLAMLGLENMTAPERDLVLRVFSYDGANYRTQVNDRISAKRAGQQPRPVYPAITLVLYFGKQRWSAPRTLRECLEVDVPPKLLKMVPNYRLHVFELARLSKKKINSFRSDFFLPVYYLNNPDRLPPEDRVIRHVDETMKLMTVITGDSKYLDVGQDLTRQGKETDVTMGYLFEQAEARGEARGISIGEARGEARGISIGEALGRNAEREAIRKEMARKDAEIAELRRKLAGFHAK